MSRFNREVDLLFSASGDFRIDSARKDFADTKNLQLRSLLQRVLTRIQSGPGDWRLQPQLGSRVAGFAGKPNSAETGELIKQAVYSALVSADFLGGEEVTIDVFPLSEHAIAIALAVVPRGSENALFVSFSYDFRDNKLVPRSF